MTTASEFQAKVTKAMTDMGRLENIVNGNSATTVTTDNGPVPSIAKFFADIESDIPDDIATALGTQILAGAGIDLDFDSGSGELTISATGGGGGGGGGVEETYASDYGIVGDDSTDNLAAWNNLVADINAGTVKAVKLPPGVIRINGDPTPITKGVAIRGCGPKATVISDYGGTSPLLEFDSLAPSECIVLEGFSLQTTQQEGRDAILAEWNNTPAGFNIHLWINAVEIRGTGAVGFANGLRMHNCIMARVNGLWVNGRINGSSSAQHGNMGNAIHITSDTGYYSVGHIFTQCAVIGANWGLRAETHVEGIYWLGNDVEFCRNGIKISATDTTTAPSFIVRDSWMEFYEQGIVVENVSRLTISGNQMLRNSLGADTPGHFVLVADSLGVLVCDNEMVCADPSGITTYGVAFSNVSYSMSKSNLMGGFRGAGVIFTGNSSYCQSIDDVVDWPQGSGVQCINDSSNALTNSFRGMKGAGVTFTYRGSSGGSIGFGGGSTFTTMVSTSNMRVVTGEEYRVTAQMSATSISANMSLGFRMREFNHRPAASVPFDVFQVANADTQILDTKAVFSGTSGRFMIEATIRIVNTADDARFDFDLNSDTGTASCNAASVEVARL